MSAPRSRGGDVAVAIGVVLACVALVTLRQTDRGSDPPDERPAVAGSARPPAPHRWSGSSLTAAPPLAPVADRSQTLPETLGVPPPASPPAPTSGAPPRWLDAVTRAEAAIVTGDFAAAEAALLDALAEAERGDPGGALVVDSLGRLSTLAQRTQRFADAAGYADRALDVAVARYGADDVAVAAQLDALGDAVRLVPERRGEARELAERALAVRESALGPTSAELAPSLGRLADAIRFGGEPGVPLTDADQRRAEDLYRRAVSVTERARGAEDPALVKPLGDLGRFQLSQGRYDDARVTAERAVALLDADPERDPAVLGAALGTLAAAYQRGGRDAEAEEAMRRNVAVTEQSFGPAAATGTRLVLGRFLLSRGETRAAEEELGRALAVTEERYGRDHPATATALATLGALYRDTGRTADAEATYRRILGAGESVDVTAHRALGWTLRSASLELATLLRSDGRDEEAAALEARAAELGEALHPTRRP